MLLHLPAAEINKRNILVYHGSTALSPGGREGLGWAKAAGKPLLLK